MAAAAEAAPIVLLVAAEETAADMAEAFAVIAVAPTEMAAADVSTEAVLWLECPGNNW